MKKILIYDIAIKWGYGRVTGNESISERIASGLPFPADGSVAPDSLTITLAVRLIRDIHRQILPEQREDYSKDIALSEWARTEARR